MNRRHLSATGLIGRTPAGIRVVPRRQNIRGNFCPQILPFYTCASIVRTNLHCIVHIYRELSDIEGNTAAAKSRRLAVFRQRKSEEAGAGRVQERHLDKLYKCCGREIFIFNRSLLHLSDPLASVARPAAKGIFADA